MSAIPKSVMNAAWMEEAKVYRACKGGRNYSMTEIAEAIARAIITERVRCATIAHFHLGLVPGHDPDKQGADLVAQGYGNASLNIAHSILTGEGVRD